MVIVSPLLSLHRLRAVNVIQFSSLVMLSMIKSQFIL